MADSGALGYALLGLLYPRPLSGYELRKIFATTPMRHYSDSPGSIYPALQKLRRKRLIAIARERAHNPRGRQRFMLTAKGRDALKRWIVQPIDRDMVESGIAEIVLRFSMSDYIDDVGTVRGLFAQFAQQLENYLAYLREVREKLERPSSGRLTMELGIRLYETHLQWATNALVQLDSGKEAA